MVDPLPKASESSGVKSILDFFFLINLYLKPLKVNYICWSNSRATEQNIKHHWFIQKISLSFPFISLWPMVWSLLQTTALDSPDNNCSFCSAVWDYSGGGGGPESTKCQKPRSSPGGLLNYMTRKLKLRLTRQTCGQDLTLSRLTMTEKNRMSEGREKPLKKKKKSLFPGRSRGCESSFGCRIVIDPRSEFFGVL